MKIKKNFDIFANEIVVKNGDLRKISSQLRMDGYKILGVGHESFGRSKIWYERNLIWTRKEVY